MDSLLVAMLGRASKPRLHLGISCLVVSLGLLTLQAAAQDAAPYLLAEPGEFTNILDAFDGDEDPLDFNVRLSFVRSQSDSTIERERNAAGAFDIDTLDVAQYHSVRTELVVGGEIGLYKDLMLYGRLPLVFSDTRVLRLPEAARCGSPVCQRRRMNVAQVLSDSSPGLPGTPQIFDPDPTLTSRTRSGVPDVDVGVAWGITNQYRTAHLPTWVLVLEGRFSLGDAMRACVKQGCNPGISRGTTRLRVESRWSYRYRFIEPYLGIDYAHEWAGSADEIFQPEAPALIDTSLPGITGITLGGSIVPWEQRGRFQQFAIDVRTRAEYISAGRDYTPLFDALGQSTNPNLTGSDTNLQFSGLTNVDSHALLSLDLSLVMQAARYVRFRLGVWLAHATTHLLNGATRCTDEPASGTSVCGDRAPNALYRAVIDQPGQRFQLTADLQYSLSASATGQF